MSGDKVDGLLISLDEGRISNHHVLPFLIDVRHFGEFRNGDLESRLNDFIAFKLNALIYFSIISATRSPSWVLNLGRI